MSKYMFIDDTDELLHPLCNQIGSHRPSKQKDKMRINQTNDASVETNNAVAVFRCALRRSGEEADSE